jgi:hypothetical protein
MSRLNGGLLLLCLVSWFVALTGCGSAVSTEYVEGVVTVDGKPVAEATVMFTPVTQGQGAPATGTTDANGVYKLTAVTVGEAKPTAEGGTLPGDYFVGVIKSVSATAMSEEEAYEKGVPYVAPRPGEVPEMKHEVPQKYNDPKTSGLKVTVQAGKNTIPLELKSAE